MSYDVKLFVTIPGAGTPEEQLERLMHEAERTVRPLPLPPDEVKRIEEVMADLRALDPAAQFQEIREGAHLKGFVVSNAERLPYVELGAQDGALAWSMGSDPRDLYRSLMQLTSLVARHGYLAFDHQQGAIIKPSDDFNTFMQQFADQWSSPENFRQWLAGETAVGKASAAAGPTGGATTGGATTGGATKSQPNFLGLVILAGIVIWGVYKLHKAGYF
jgi:hypothetical protein